MEKPNKVVELLIENQWLNNVVSFIAKANNIDENALKMIINGSKPDLNDEIMKKYQEKADEIINSLNSTNTEEKK